MPQPLATVPERAQRLANGEVVPGDRDAVRREGDADRNRAIRFFRGQSWSERIGVADFARSEGIDDVDRGK